MAHNPIRIALVGYGKIAADQHVPAIRANPDFELVAVVSARGAGPGDVPVFPTIEAMMTSGTAVDAASHCNTPRARLETALTTISWPMHTMLEKPPAATLGEWHMIADAAAAANVAVMTSWHSRANAAVAAAQHWLNDKAIHAVRICWHENVRKWHPGQDWVWDAGGFGVFDPGINALSIVTAILPFTPFVVAARLTTPANRAMPIAAEIDFAARGWTGAMSASFDWRATGGECWEITAETDAGILTLSEGGRRLAINGQPVLHHSDDEYPALYSEFERLVRTSGKQLDIAPLRLVADAFLLGTRVTDAPFDWR